MSSIAERVYAAAEKLQDKWEGHEVPSPSSVNKCRRQLWYIARGVPRSDRLAVRSIKKMSSGKAIEPFWHEVYSDAGFVVMTLSGGSRIDIDPMTGEFDGYLIDKSDKKIYDWEHKDLGVWSYIGIVQEGLRAAEPDYYTQVQLYMSGLRDLGIEVAGTVFHASQADSSGTLWIWQQIKKLPGEPPDFHIEIIEYDPEEVERAVQRSAVIQADIASDRLPPADYDPIPLVFNNKNKRNFPCGVDGRAYCGFRELCKSDRCS